MSLVSEALKKAQREAARREGREKGLPEPLLTGAQPWRARRASRVPLAVLLGVGLVALVGAALYFVGGSRDGKARDERRSEKGDAESVAIVASPASAVTTAGVEPLPPPSSSSEAERTSVATATGATGDRSAPVAVPAPAPAEGVDAQSRTGNPAPAPAPASAPAPANAPAPASGPASATRESIFVRSAKLASGAEVRLGGIAWSETAPLAYLNGRLLGVGEAVSGARVDRIERERVVLVAPEGRVVITLR